MRLKSGVLLNHQKRMADTSQLLSLSSPTIFVANFLGTDGTLLCATGEVKLDTGPGTWENRFCFVVMDGSDPVRLDTTALVTTPGPVYGDLAVRGQYAYVTRNNGGLLVFDLNNPSAPVLVGTYDSPGFAKDVTVAGDYAYMADGSALLILDVANPLGPVLKGTLALPASVIGVTVRGPTAYVSCSGSFVIVDVSNPVAPTRLSTTAVPTGAGSFVACKVQSGVAYCALGSGGLALYNVSNPFTPVLLGTLPEAGNGSTVRLEVSGQYVFLANQAEGIWMIDASNPAALKIVASWHGTGNVGDVALTSSGLMFAAAGVQGVATFSVPAAPMRAAIAYQPGAIEVSIDPAYSGTRLEASADLKNWQDAGDVIPLRQAVPEVETARFFRATSGVQIK